MKKSTTISKCGLLTLASLFACSAEAQQLKAITECYPSTLKSVCGVSSLERERFINMAGSSAEAASKASPEQARYLFEDLDITFGRGLGLVRSESYGNNLREDPNRPGYADIDYLRKNLKPTKLSTNYYQRVFGDSEMLATHDGHDAYPSFMEKYNLTKEQKHEHSFPENTDAAGEIAATILKYKFDDFSRPKYFEPVNEPTWQVWKDDRFISFHTDIKRHVDALGLDVEVGGPCLSVSNFYGKEYASVKSIYDFIDKTKFGLDFYSFHSYDYYTWNRDTKEFEGQINSGTPLEGVFDAVASYTFNNYGREFTYVATEHGGYMPGESYGAPKEGDIRKEAFDYYANKYFPGEGFEFDVKRRSVDNFLMLSSTISNTMVFMNQPHIVKKAVPFILLDTSNWDPYYYSTLLNRENFEKNNPSSIICPLVYFYEFFKGVDGDFVHSWCDSGDIQHLAYVNDDEFILVYHNKSNESGEVTINLNDFDQKVKQTIVRRVGRNEDHTPYLSEDSERGAVESFEIGAQESVALFFRTKGDVKTTRELKEIAHYATEQSVQFDGSHTFEVSVADAAQVEESFLRVGINRANGVQDGISIRLNGVELEYEVDLSADRYTGKDGFTTTKIIHLPKGAVKSNNSVEVSFADGGKGGVGAVVLRTLSE